MPRVSPEKLQAMIAEAQLAEMKKVASHLDRLRSIEMKKAENELAKSEIERDTARVINETVKRIEASHELPPIKLS